MSELNLIKCMNHMNEILLRLENFIDEECSDFSSNTITLDNIVGIKEGYAQLIWIEELYTKLFKKIKKTKGKYDKKLNPLISEVQYTVTNELKNMNKKYNAAENLKLPEFNIYYPDINLLNLNDWAETQEYYNNVDEIISMNELGWPGSVDNIKPLQKILFNRCFI